MRRIKKLAGGHPKVLNVHKILIHDYLSKYFISLHIVVDSDMPLYEAQAVVEAVANKLEKKFKADVTVQICPYSEDGTLWGEEDEYYEE
jgi:divalent metal cation (Fe/Co/Zn/Cd) transporter